MFQPFEKAPLREYRRRSFVGRLVRRPLTLLSLIAATVLVTAFAIQLTRVLRHPTVAQPKTHRPVSHSVTTSP